MARSALWHNVRDIVQPYMPSGACLVEGAPLDRLVVHATHPDKSLARAVVLRLEPGLIRRLRAGDSETRRRIGQRIAAKLATAMERSYAAGDPRDAFKVTFDEALAAED